MRLQLSACVASLSSFFPAAIAAAQGTLEQIDIPAGYNESRALSVSADGSRVVGFVTEPSGAWRAIGWWHEGGTFLLDDGDVPDSPAFEISPDGSVVVGAANAVPNHTFGRPCMWVNGGPLVQFGGSYNVVNIAGASMNGSVIAGSYAVGSWRYLTDTNTVQSLRDAQSEGNCRAQDVSDGGLVVGRAMVGANNQACYWPLASQNPALLGMLAGDTSSGASAVSADGSLIVGISRSAAQARLFRWTQATGMSAVTEAGTYASFDEREIFLSGDGSLLAANPSPIGTAIPFVVRDGVRHELPAFLAMHGVDTTGWTFRTIKGMSFDGSTLVGQARNSKNQLVGWIATLGNPCPADFDGDGFLTGFDYDLYVQTFEAGGTSADFDGDGFITGTDFDLYVLAFEKGC